VSAPSYQPMANLGRHRQSGLFQSVLTFFGRRPIWVLCVVLFAFFASQSRHFLTPFNLSNVLFQCSLIGFLAIGLSPVVISRNIDLSVGANAGLAACIAVGAQDYGLAPALIASLAAATCVGAVNGLVVELTGVSSFIVTLGALAGVRGLAFLYTGDTSLSSPDERLSDLGHMSVGPISVIAIGFMLSVILISWLLRNTVHGRNTYAVGGSREAAVNAGIRPSRHIIFNFAISGFFAGVCGIGMAADLGAATPSYGKDYELWAVIAVVLGGASLRGGTGSAWGTFAAVLTLAILRNGLNLIHVSPFYITAIIGPVLIAATVIDAHLNRRSRRAGE
jgi:ribose transport system permease protein